MNWVFAHLLLLYFCDISLPKISSASYAETLKRDCRVISNELRSCEDQCQPEVCSDVFDRYLKENCIQPPKENQCSCKEVCAVKGFIPINGRCYYFSNEAANWEDSEKKCKSMFPGSILAQFETSEETASVIDFLMRVDNVSVYWWLGGNDYASQNDFRWVAGNGKVNNGDWCQEEPDTHLVQRCVHIDIYDKKYCLGNFYCDFKSFEGIYPFRYICEMPSMFS